MHLIILIGNDLSQFLKVPAQQSLSRILTRTLLKVTKIVPLKKIYLPVAKHRILLLIMNPVILVMKILMLCLYVVSHAEGECVKSTWEGEEKGICIQSIKIHKNGSVFKPIEVCQIIIYQYSTHLALILEENIYNF